MHNMISDDNDDDNNSIAGSRNNHPQDADLRCYYLCKQPTYLRYFNTFICTGEHVNYNFYVM